MTANTVPIYSGKPDIQASGLIATAATVVYDGSGTIATDVYKIFTADATNGGFVQRVRIQYVPNAGTTSTACVIRLYISNKTSGATTNADTWLYDAVVIPAIAMSTTVYNGAFDVPFGFAIPASYTILAKISVTQPASCGFIATAIAGSYTA